MNTQTIRRADGTRLQLSSDFNCGYEVWTGPTLTTRLGKVTNVQGRGWVVKSLSGEELGVVKYPWDGANLLLERSR